MRIAQKIKLLPLFPPYSMVENLLLSFQKSTKMERISHLLKAIKEQQGTPQKPLDWRDPDRWIEERLDGINRKIARHLWRHQINPRYIQGVLSVVKQYQLISINEKDKIELTLRGHRFLDQEPTVYQEIDHTQGMYEILSILSVKDRVQRKDILPEWETFLLKYTNYSQPSATKDTLRRRLINLEERGLLLRDGNHMQISELGMQCLHQINAFPQEDKNTKQELLKSLEKYNDLQRDLLKKRLFRVSPYRFEQMIKDLLEAMGYEDVEVTQASGDYGVDVVASIQFGITTIKEVIQVKRVQGSVGRPILDQLRGALHYFGALRGTIITTGTFTKQCKEKALFPGAAPIGLIDGDRLLDLMIQHEVGVKKRTTVIHQLDESYFSPDLL